MTLRIAQFYGDKRNTGQYDNGVWMDILQIPYIQKIEEAADYDVIIRTLWLDSTGWSKEIRKRFPNVIQIGLSDHPLSTHVSKMAPDRQVAYLDDLRYLDGLMALTEEERQWYQTALPSIPVIKGGLPFPFESYTETYGHLFESEKRFIGLGVGASDNDRNFISSAIAFNALKESNTGLTGLYLSLPSYQVAPTAVYADYFGDIYLHERIEMMNFYQRLSECHFVFAMADRNTPGRIQGEAAFFGVPVIGSNRLELQTELFPKLAVSPYSLEDAVWRANWLLDNPQEREGIIAYAREKLSAYNYRKSRGRFNKLLREIIASKQILGV